MHVDDIVDKIKAGTVINVISGPYAGLRTMTAYYSSGPRVRGVWIETSVGERLVYAEEIEEI